MKRAVLLGSVAAASLVFFLMAGTVATAGPGGLTARALVDRNEISLGEALELSVVLSGGSGDVDTSAIRDFDVIYRGQSSSFQMVNADVRHELTLHYSLTPRRAGDLIIPPLTVRSGSDSVSTEPVRVRVVQGTASTGGDDLLMTATVSNASPWLGEEIVYTFRFMAAVRVYKANYRRPSFDGFSVRDLQGQKEFSDVKNGRRYKVTEVSYLLTPERSGPLTVDSGDLTCEVADPGGNSRSRSPFGSIFDDPFFSSTRTVTRTVRAEAVPVKVRPLPEYRGSGTFSGLIGNFSFSASVEPLRLKAGDSATITVSVEGSGNIMDLAEPGFPVPPGFKIYPDSPQEKVKSDASGTRGSKVFRYALVPVYSGQYSVGPFELVFFDTEKGKYIRRRVQAASVRVDPGDGSEKLEAEIQNENGAGGAVAPLVRKKKVRQTGHDILSVNRDMDALVPQGGMGLAAFISLLALPPFLFAGVRVLQSKRGRALTPGRLMCKRADELLKEAVRESQKGDASNCYGLLHRSLASSVFGAAGRSGEALTYQEAGVLLEQASVDKGLSEAVVQKLEEIDSARYGGIAGKDPGSLIQDVKRLVRELCR